MGGNWVESAVRTADNSRVERTQEPPAVAISGRLRVAQLLAFVALLAALVGALGPADRVHTAYSWPPPTLPDESPQSLWYTPLLLAQHRPDAIAANVPCTLPPALPGAARPLTVLATARHPARTDSLALTSAGNGFVLAVGERVLDRIPLGPEPTEPDCTFRLTLAGGGWSWDVPSRGLSGSGSLDETPVVFGLFSALDLRSADAPSIEILSATHATRTTVRQFVAWTIAVAALAAALLLVSASGVRGSAARLAPAWRAARGAAGPVDAVVGVVLVGWWVLSPAFFDDGWIAAREHMFEESGGFSHYYNTFGVNLPLDYWVEWLQHWVVQSSHSLLVQRIPSLLCLAAVWVVCRWTFARIQPPTAGGPRSPELWALASAFLAGALAWGMTLRPEPFVALLVIGVLACMVRFVERPAAAPVAAAAVLVPLGLTSHPEGVVVLAPVLAASPSLLRWARPRLPIASTIVSSGIALVAVLAFLGSDLSQRRDDAQTIVEFGHSVAWRYELIRYTSLADFPWGTPLRRFSVVLMVLALVAFLLWRRRAPKGLLDLPVLALGLALLLFVVTPSKHPWHFGALIGLTAVTVAAETARLRMSRSALPGMAQPLLVLVGAAVVAIWSWAPRHDWNSIDLRTLDWTPSAEKVIGFSTLAAILPLALAAVLAVRARGKERGDAGSAPGRVVPWLAPVLAVPLIVFTIGVVLADTAATSGWTLARQNLGTLRGAPGCGIADDLVVAVPSSARGLSRTQGTDALPVWAPAPPVPGLAVFALGPNQTGVASTPWIDLPSEPFGLFVAGNPAPAELVLERGALDQGRVTVVAADPISATDTLDVRSAALAWRLVAASELPAPAQDSASVFRLTRRSPEPPGTSLAVSGPVAYRTEALTPRLERAGAKTLVLPDVVPYFPCARLPVLSDGVVEVPDHVVATRHGSWLFQEEQWSPFAGLRDLYRFERTPVADSKAAPVVLEVFAVDRRIPGAAEAAPLARTLTD